MSCTQNYSGFSSVCDVSC